MCAPDALPGCDAGSEAASPFPSLIGVAMLLAGEGGAWVMGNLISTGYWLPHFLPRLRRTALRQTDPGLVSPFILLALAGTWHDVKPANLGPLARTLRRPADPARLRCEPGDIVFTYHGGDRPALRRQSHTQPGKTIGIMGASGTGKSTIAKCLNRIVPAFEGGIFTARSASPRRRSRMRRCSFGRHGLPGLRGSTLFDQRRA